jgi:hypothetical protein
VADVSSTACRWAPTRCWQPGEGLAHIEEAVDFATALLCAEAVGAMQSPTTPRSST